MQRVELVYNSEEIVASPEQEREIQKLRTAYGDGQGRVFTGTSASEERAKIEAARYGILHFAAPAILDDASPMYSFIALSPGESNHEDGLLQSWEILNLHSQARLVVLSEASTKRERVGAGDAAIALAWSWFVAGTPTLISSRWKVESPIVTRLMTEFYSNLNAGPKLRRSNPPAEVLRQSALTLRRSGDYQHPYYWSAFLLLGNER